MENAACTEKQIIVIGAGAPIVSSEIRRVFAEHGYKVLIEGEDELFEHLHKGHPAIDDILACFSHYSPVRPSIKPHLIEASYLLFDIEDAEQSIMPVEAGAPLAKPINIRHLPQRPQAPPRLLNILPIYA